jgi:hypothetical protein
MWRSSKSCFMPQSSVTRAAAGKCCYALYQCRKVSGLTIMASGPSFTSIPCFSHQGRSRAIFCSLASR